MNEIESIPPEIVPNRKMLKNNPYFRLALIVCIFLIIIFYLLSKLYSPPKVTQLPLSATPVSSPTPSPLIFKTYVNTDLGYQIQYPSDWTVTEKPTILQSPDQRDVPIPRYSLAFNERVKTSLSFLEIASRSGESCIGSCPESGEKSNPDFYKIVPPGVNKNMIDSVHEYYLVTPISNPPMAIIPLPENKKYYLEISPMIWPKNSDYSLFYQILFSFKFVSLTDTSTWANYTNSDQGYTVNYPDFIYQRRKCIGEELLLVPVSEQIPDREIECGRDTTYLTEFRTYDKSSQIPSAFVKSADYHSQNIITKKKTYLVNGLEAVEYVSTRKTNVIDSSDNIPEWSKEVYINHAGKIHLIFTTDQQRETLFNHMLSTLKFINNL
jgi:hypothetical protein